MQELEPESKAEDSPGASALNGSTRRKFIRNFVVGTALSTIMGRGSWYTLLADCVPTQAGAGILKIRVADFPGLQAANGSVRLSFNAFTSGGPSGAFYPVLINRGANDQFFSLSTRCMHADCVVPTFDKTAKAITCPCHGSQYAIDGKVIRGPTTRPLSSYLNSFDGSILCVEIPNLGFSTTGTAVETGTGPRFQLKFSTKSQVKYQVVFRQSIDDPGTNVPFSSTIGGAASSTVFNGTGASATVFVDRTEEAGFYSIAVQVKNQ